MQPIPQSNTRQNKRARKLNSSRPRHLERSRVSSHGSTGWSPQHLLTCFVVGSGSFVDHANGGGWSCVGFTYYCCELVKECCGGSLVIIAPCFWNGNVTGMPHRLIISRCNITRALKCILLPEKQFSFLSVKYTIMMIHCSFNVVFIVFLVLEILLELTIILILQENKLNILL